jgi:hypothetical protein
MLWMQPPSIYACQFSLGTFPQEQRRCQTSYVAGSKGKHTHVYPYFGRQAARCQRSRSATVGSRRILCNGQRLPGFRKALCIQPSACFFVTRAKIKYAIQKAIFTYSRQNDRPSLRSNNHAYRFLYKQVLSRHSASREISRCGHHTETLLFLTNNFSLPALTIAQLYRSRWQVELFFKWIKQHLRIKSFYGHLRECGEDSGLDSSLVYVLVAIMKKRLNLQESLYTILQILSVTSFEKVPFYQLVTEMNYKNPDQPGYKQLKLF